MGQAKHAATVSLVAMGAGFLATLPFQDNHVGELLQSGFEAGLVGGLADWFAVTALFRHPLGIPIPHTALLPKNRDRVVDSLISAIENDLLTEESLKAKVAELRIHERLLSLAEERLAEGSAAVVSMAEYGLRQLQPAQVVEWIYPMLRSQAESFDLRSVLNRVQQEIIHRGYDEQAVSFLLDKAENLVGDPHFRQQVGAMAAEALSKLQVNGLMQLALNAFIGYMTEEKLGTMIQNMLLNNIQEMKANQEHPLRMLLLLEIRRMIVSADENPKLLEALEGWRASVLNHPETPEKLAKILDDLRHKALQFISGPGFEEQYVQPLLRKVVDHLRNSPDLMDKVQIWLQSQLSRLIEANHSKIGQLIRENVDKFDNKMLIEMMEDKIGKDLQWIRVNGAVCGFLIGIILQGIKFMV
ncbi:DUF445 domain-containing protein [Paenibacillus swuensis]|nr:DUF445 domain-containing protein [Paenibacillus swuensis]